MMKAPFFSKGIWFPVFRERPYAWSCDLFFFFFQAHGFEKCDLFVLQVIKHFSMVFWSGIRVLLRST